MELKYAFLFHSSNRIFSCVIIFVYVLLDQVNRSTPWKNQKDTISTGGSVRTAIKFLCYLSDFHL